MYSILDGTAGVVVGTVGYTEADPPSQGFLIAGLGMEHSDLSSIKI